jgi:two-component sensor histidine kinase
VRIAERRVKIKNTGTVSRERLSQVDRHLRALGAVYDILAQENEGEEVRTPSVSAVSVFHRLQPLLEQTAGERRLRYEIEEARLSVQQGWALALIVMELVKSAAKHAYRDISVTLTSRDQKVKLTVDNDGPAYEQMSDVANGSAGELHIVESLNRHFLRGRLRQASRPEGGTHVSITFFTARLSG